jgi:hypothetical protein
MEKEDEDGSEPGLRNNGTMCVNAVHWHWAGRIGSQRQHSKFCGGKHQRRSSLWSMDGVSRGG